MTEKRYPMLCLRCGSEMNHHADKVVVSADVGDEAIVDPVLGGIVEEHHACPACGAGASRRAPRR